jgi:hypothetical protein
MHRDAHRPARQAEHGAVSRNLKDTQMTTDTATRIAAPPGIQYSLNPAQLFKDFARTGLPLRDPATDIIGLFCKSAVGCCLDPLIVAGDQIFIDLNARPEHGDIVYFEWPPETVAHWNASDRGADWANRWGAHDMSRGVKLFWEYPHGAPDWVPKENLLLTNEDSTKVGTHKLLGVVRAVIRNGVMLTTLGLAACDSVAPYAAPGSEIPVASIDPNAATELMETTVASSTSTSGALGLSVNVITSTVPAKPQDYTAILTATGRVWTSAANTWLVFIGHGGTTIAGSNTTSTAAPGETIAYRGNVFVPAGTSPTFTFSWQTTGAGTINGTNLHFQVEAIKK